MAEKINNMFIVNNITFIGCEVTEEEVKNIPTNIFETINDKRRNMEEAVKYLLNQAADEVEKKQYDKSLECIEKASAHLKKIGYLTIWQVKRKYRDTDRHGNPYPEVKEAGLVFSPHPDLKDIINKSWIINCPSWD